MKWLQTVRESVTDVKKMFVGLMAGTAAVNSMPGTQPEAKAADSEHPNVILILADDLGWTDINCRPLQKNVDGTYYKNPQTDEYEYVDPDADANGAETYDSKYYKTPNLAWLREHGMRFTNAYAACPISAPTRASIMTGQYTARLGMTHLPGSGTTTGYELVPPPSTDLEGTGVEKILPEILKDNGYDTACIGKWHLTDSNSMEDHSRPEYQGFDLVTGLDPTRINYFYSEQNGFSADGHKEYFRYVKKNEQGVPIYDPNWIEDPNNVDIGDYLIDILRREACNFVTNENGDRDPNNPFFLYLALDAVHWCPKSFYLNDQLLETKASDYDKAGEPKPEGSPIDERHINQYYAGMINNMDQNIGKVLDAVENDSNLKNNTIIIFISDNGGQILEAYGRAWDPNEFPDGDPYASSELEQVTLNTPLSKGKATIHEGGVRVPMIVKYPGFITPNTTSNVSVSTIDILPTILEMAGIDQAEALPSEQVVDGESLWPVLDMNQQATELQRDSLFWHFPHYVNHLEGHRNTPSSAMVKRIGDDIYKLRYYFYDHNNTEWIVDNGQYHLFNLTENIEENMEDNLATNPVYQEVLFSMLYELYNWYEDVEAPMPTDAPSSPVISLHKVIGVKYDNTLEAFNSISEAISDNNVTTVVLWPGVHTENISINREITLRSFVPNDPACAAMTIVDGNDSNSVIIANSDCTIRGLTITNGETTSNGGGINGNDNSVNVSNCIIYDNSAFAGGGVFGCHGTISNCQIYNNDADYGGGIAKSWGIILNCLVYDNQADVNGGGLNNCDAVISNCTIADNTATSNGGGLNNCNTDNNTNASITNCIIWGNDSDQLAANCINPTYSCIQNWTSGGTGNITTNPSFIENDVLYHLSFGSQCIDVGNPNDDYSGQTDIDGQERVMQKYIDMGADEATPRVYNVTQDKWYPFIQDAMNDANDLDELIAYPDTYVENVIIDRNVTLSSCDPNNPAAVAATIVDGNDIDSVIIATSDCAIEGLSLTGGNSAQYLQNGGGIRGALNITVNVSNCKIYDNKAYAGAGIYDCHGMISNCEIYGNIAEAVMPYGLDGFGGGLARCHGNISNCLIYGNYADANGGGLNNCDAVISNCSIVDNIAGNVGGGLHNCNIEGANTDTAIINCIIWDNDSDQLVNCIEPTYSCIEEWLEIDTNTGSDPLFVDSNNFDYHLSCLSPCIDTGDPNEDYTGQTDIDGEYRVMGSTVDMGADEFAGAYNLSQNTWYSYIQDAIDDSNSFDTIIIYPGIYYENMNIGRDVIIQSAYPDDFLCIEKTVVDGENLNSVFTANSDCTIRGLTITNGETTSNGGGINGNDNSVDVSNCIIYDNSAFAGGGVFGCHGTISNCQIYNNDADYGGGIAKSWGIILNCLVYDNQADVNGGGLNNCDAVISNCTVVGNSAVNLGSGMYNCDTEDNSNASITNCIIWGNTNTTNQIDNYVMPSYCCIQGWTGGGTDNINSDPNFVDAAYHLSAGSPCVDAGTNSAVSTGDVDIDGDDRIIDGDGDETATVDMGADEYQD